MVFALVSGVSLYPSRTSSVSTGVARSILENEDGVGSKKLSDSLLSEIRYERNT